MPALPRRLAKADLTTDMVREFTELQGMMGGIYAREDGLGEGVWKAIYHQYQPVGVEAQQAPTAAHLGDAALTWAALAVADRVDTLVGLFAAGEQPTGTRDPFALRRAAQGLVKVLVDLPEVGGVTRQVSLDGIVGPRPGAGMEEQGLVQDVAGKTQALGAFVVDRLRFLFEKRGYRADEIAAVLPEGQGLTGLSPLSVRQRLDALRVVRPSDDFEPLAVLFKRATNIVKDVPPGDPSTADLAAVRAVLVEPAELALVDALEARRTSIADRRRPRRLHAGTSRSRRVAASSRSFLHRGLRHGRRRRPAPGPPVAAGCPARYGARHRRSFSNRGATGLSPVFTNVL